MFWRLRETALAWLYMDTYVINWSGRGGSQTPSPRLGERASEKIWRTVTGSRGECRMISAALPKISMCKEKKMLPVLCFFSCHRDWQYLNFSFYLLPNYPLQQSMPQASVSLSNSGKSPPFKCRGAQTAKCKQKWLAGGSKSLTSSFGNLRREKKSDDSDVWGGGLLPHIWQVAHNRSDDDVTTYCSWDGFY